ncbi:MAG: RNA polymerase sigma factor [bacterium]
MASHTAFEILYKDYYRRVFGLCRRLLVSNQLAEDATQETFMRAYKNFATFKAEQPFWQWIASIANNHCIDVLRSKHRTDQLFGEETDELTEVVSADRPALSDLIAFEESNSLNRAVAALPDKYRVPLVLAYFHEASYEDIADHLQVSRNHVGVLLLRAKQHLRASLADGTREDCQ